MAVSPCDGPAARAVRGPRARLLDLSTRYRRDLLAHIDAEENAARDGADRLLALYPPSEDADAIRGEGCVICPSYGISCEGLEREWWSEEEWDDFRERAG